MHVCAELAAPRAGLAKAKPRCKQKSCGNCADFEWNAKKFMHAMLDMCVVTPTRLPATMSDELATSFDKACRRRVQTLVAGHYCKPGITYILDESRVLLILFWIPWQSVWQS